MRIPLLVTGRRYHLAASLPEALELPAGSTVDDALRALTTRLPDGDAFPPSCLVAVSGEHLGTIAAHRPRTLAADDELLLIAPVAGG